MASKRADACERTWAKEVVVAMVETRMLDSLESEMSLLQLQDRKFAKGFPSLPLHGPSLICNASDKIGT